MNKFLLLLLLVPMAAQAGSPMPYLGNIEPEWDVTIIDDHDHGEGEVNTYRKFDNIIYDDEGNTWSIYDDITYGSDGSICEEFEDITYCR